MPVTASDIKFRLSGGSANSDVNASLGGVKSSVDAVNYFDNVSSGEAAAGDIEYRCIYIHNNSSTNSLLTAKIWIDTNTPSADTTVEIGLGTAAINATEQTVANESTAPSGVTFTAPANEGAGLTIGDIPVGQHKAVWIRRTVNAAAAAAADSFTLRVKGDTLA